MAKFTKEQTELVVEKLLDIMINGGNSKMKSAVNNLPDPAGSGMGLMFAILSGVTGHGKGNMLSEDEIKKLRTALTSYISSRSRVEFGADYGIECPLSEILINTIGRAPMVLSMKSFFSADYKTGVSYSVVRTSSESWTFEQLAEEYKAAQQSLNKADSVKKK